MARNLNTFESREWKSGKVEGCEERLEAREVDAKGQTCRVTQMRKVILAHQDILAKIDSFSFPHVPVFSFSYFHIPTLHSFHSSTFPPFHFPLTGL